MRYANELILASLVSAAGLVHPVHAGEACNKEGQVVLQVMASKVAAYDAAGNIAGTIDKAKIVTNEPIRECMNDPQLVRVHVTDEVVGRKKAGESVFTAWVDRLEVKISGNDTKASRPCKAAPPTAANDKKVPAVSGIDQCSGS